MSTQVPVLEVLEEVLALNLQRGDNPYRVWSDALLECEFGLYTFYALYMTSPHSRLLGGRLLPTLTRHMDREQLLSLPREIFECVVMLLDEDELKRWFKEKVNPRWETEKVARELPSGYIATALVMEPQPTPWLNILAAVRLIHKNRSTIDVVNEILSNFDFSILADWVNDDTNKAFGRWSARIEWLDTALELSSRKVTAEICLTFTKPQASVFATYMQKRNRHAFAELQLELRRLIAERESVQLEQRTVYEALGV